MSNRRPAAIMVMPVRSKNRPRFQFQMTKTVTANLTNPIDKAGVADSGQGGCVVSASRTGKDEEHIAKNIRLTTNCCVTDRKMAI
jgi:hypothetical protein